MNDAHLHLLFNHFPIMGGFFSLAVLGVGFITKNAIVKRVGLGILIFSALFTLPAFFSGEGAEELVEELPGVSHDVIHEHEEIAELSLWISQLAGILAAIALYLDVTAHRLSKMALWLTLVLNAVFFIVMARVGNTGGEIRHQEISHAAGATHSTAEDHGDHD